MMPGQFTGRHMALAMLGFFGTVVLSKYVVRRDIVE